MNKKKIEGILSLFAAAVIWGTAFVAQTAASDSLGAFTFNACRSFTASTFLALLIFYKKIGEKETVSSLPSGNTDINHVNVREKLYKYGLICGVALFFGFGFQQSGISTYPSGIGAAGRAGFITSVQVVIVPLIECVFGKKPRLTLVISIVGIITGMYLLCMTNGIDGFYLGDLLILLCAFAFAIYVIVVGKCSELDSLRLCCIQFFICGILSLGFAFFTETISINMIFHTIGPILYAGIFSSGIAYVLQAIGQKHVEPTVATIIISLESVIAAFAGWLLLHEVLRTKEIIGCILVFVSSLLAQLQSITLDTKGRENMRRTN